MKYFWINVYQHYKCWAAYFGVDHKFVHASGPQGGPDGIHNNSTCIDVADELPFALAGVCAFLQ